MYIALEVSPIWCEYILYIKGAFRRRGSVNINGHIPTTDLNRVHILQISCYATRAQVILLSCLHERHHSSSQSLMLED